MNIFTKKQKLDLGLFNMKTSKPYLIYTISQVLFMITYYISYKYFNVKNDKSVMIRFFINSLIYILFAYANYLIYKDDTSKKYLLLLAVFALIVAIMHSVKALVAGGIINIGDYFNKIHIVTHVLYIFVYYSIYLYSELNIGTENTQPIISND